MNTEEIPELPEYLFHKARANIIEEIDVVRLFNHYASAPESMKIVARQLIKDGWTFQVVKQSRGRCYFKQKTITIPFWVLKYEASKVRWYISHEMSHALTGPMHDHDDFFMQNLKRICPLEDQHWEYSYKPQAAKRNGLSQIGVL